METNERVAISTRVRKRRRTAPTRGRREHSDATLRKEYQKINQARAQAKDRDAVGWQPPKNLPRDVYVHPLRISAGFNGISQTYCCCSLFLLDGQRLGKPPKKASKALLRLQGAQHFSAQCLSPTQGIKRSSPWLLLFHTMLLATGMFGGQVAEPHGKNEQQGAGDRQTRLDQATTAV